MRSMLFVPGDRPERFGKAGASGADAVIVDLEDAVAAPRRADARRHVAEWLREGRREVPCWVRVNPADTSDALEDLVAVVAGRPDGIVLPKARSGADLERLDHWLEALEVRHGFERGTIEVVALVTETAQALLNAASFATPPARVTGYSWGAEDLSAEVGATASRDANGDFESLFRQARSACLLMAAAANVTAIDTTDMEFRDLAALERRARASSRDGFAGKLAIHPAQVPVIHAAFTPGEAEVTWARRVVEALSGARGAVALDGRMVDRPHLRQAEKILRAAGENGDCPHFSKQEWGQSP